MKSFIINKDVIQKVDEKVQENSHFMISSLSCEFYKSPHVPESFTEMLKSTCLPSEISNFLCVLK